MSESPEGELRSLPEERAEKLARRIEGADDFIASLESLVERQRVALEEIRESLEIPDDEKSLRLESVQETLEAVLARIEEERVRNAGREEQMSRLQHIHEQGKILLDSIDTKNPQ